jgi:hypothetical protein
MYLARLLQQRREAIGTRAGRRALSPWSQAVLVLRWFLDGTRIRQLAADNAIGVSTCYRHLQTDLGYVSVSSAIRHPHKKPEGGELTEDQKAYNAVIPLPGGYPA